LTLPIYDNNIQSDGEVDKELAQMTEKERKVLANHYAVLSNVVTVTAPMYGWWSCRHLSHMQSYFGIEIFGTSLLWCSVVAGAAGGYGGSKLGGSFGKDAGELIYKAAN
jgi:hypothetical protein